MPIKVGDRLPNATFRVMTPDGPKPKTTDEVFKGKKVVLFAVPGAFTPTCQQEPSARLREERRRHQGQGHRRHRGDRRQRCVRAWTPGRRQPDPDDKIEFLADGNARFRQGDRP